MEASGWEGPHLGSPAPSALGQNGPVPPAAPPDTAVRPRPPLVTLPRVVMSVLLALSLAGLYVAFTLHDDSPNPRFRPAAVRTVSPEPGTLELRQTEIFVELVPAYTATLAVNGIAIPEDQVKVIEGLNRYSFTPGPDAEVPALPAGANCAEVRFRPVTPGAGEPGRYRWCFNLH